MKNKCINVLGKKLIYLFIATVFTNATSEPISPNGFSGLGIVPSAKTIERGRVGIGFDPTVPGALITQGYNTQVGFGLNESLELVGRLATNDQRCNMFMSGACPPNTYRDFSSSVKYALPFEWLKNYKSSLAVGVTDFGGAATYFRSYYLVGSKTFDQLEFSLGRASAKVPTSMLNGTMAALAWQPSTISKVSLQKVGQTTTAHGALESEILSSGVNGWLTINRRLSDAPTTQRSWMGVGVSMPLDGVGVEKSAATPYKLQDPTEEKKLSKIKPIELASALKDKGFYSLRMGVKGGAVIAIELENTAYLWNTLDAAGVALGVISSAYASESVEQNFELVITSRGIRQLKVVGEANCIGLWLSKGVACSKMSVHSLLQRSSDTAQINSSAAKLLLDEEESVQWEAGQAWQFRPEIIVSPTILSAVGTEYGSFDFEVGANINAVLPLWAGATLESNRLEPLGIGTRQFEQGGAFFGSRIKPVTNRKMIHQLINLPNVNSQARLSVGTSYANWDGRQIETSTQSGNGRHRVGYTAGSFKNEELASNNERRYGLLSYRFASNDQNTAVTELTQGKFWGGDRGFSVNQRFWYGDTTLNVYFRRTRMGEGQPLVSFAGLQFAIPFTPRENKSLEHLGFRGVSQWTYTLETKVLEKDNNITGGYGEVPRMGESLVTTFNRDRNSTRYYDTSLGRIRNAYLNLGNKQ
jgi:hypothetical protein